jgi:hypothetical protein
MCVLIFSTTLFETFLILCRTEKDVVIYIYIYIYIYICLRVNCPLFLSYFNKILFSRYIFEKYSNKEFHKNPCSGSRVVSYGQTDGRVDGRAERQTDWHEEARSCSSQFCDRPLKETNYTLSSLKLTLYKV